MPHVIQLDLSQQSGDVVVGGERHWLLDALYGRDLLKDKLRKSRPDLTVSRWAVQEHLDDVLEGMVDQLGLRDWPEPVGALARLRCVPLVLRMMMAVDANKELPDWRQL